MAIGNEEELFSEASGELQSEVEDALDRARESLPDHESVVVEEGGLVSEIVAGLPGELDPSEPAEALRTAQKRVALGEQADAFDEDFVAEVTTDIDQVEEAVDALRTVADTAPELAAALTRLEDEHPETQDPEDDPTDSPPDENPPADSSSETGENPSVASDEESAQKTINEETDPTTEDDEMD